MQVRRPDVLEHFQGRMDNLIATTSRLVSVESPSNDIGALSSCAEVVANEVHETLGVDATWVLEDDRRPHLRVDLGDRTDVLLVGHFDTVYPLGTLEQHRFRVDGDRMYGPGALDMKGGVAMIIETARWLQRADPRPNVTLFFNSDEEIASVYSGPRLREVSRGARLVVVHEYTDLAGVVKVGSRGARWYRVTVRGKGGHAAYPEMNRNPVEMLADVILATRPMHRPEIGQVVVPTVVKGALSPNAVPDEATVFFDARVAKARYVDDLDAHFFGLDLSDQGFEVEVGIEVDIPTHEADWDGYPWRLAQEMAEQLGLTVEGVMARGGSDVNQIAPANANVIEALGARGGGAHAAEREYVDLASLPAQTALGALMVERALADSL